MRSKERALWKVTGILVLVCTAFGLFWCSQAAQVPERLRGLQRRVIHYQGMPRIFWLHVPLLASADHLSQPPVVMMLHGGGGRGRLFDRLTRGELTRLSDRDGIILVFPEGYKRQWNDGRESPSIPAYQEGIDDVGFLDAVIDDVLDEFDADPKRVYVAGISNGGMMTNRLACEIPDKIAAIAMVVSAMPEKLAPKCPKSMDLSVMIINGTDDPLVPYEGGEVNVSRVAPYAPQKRGRVLSTEKTALFWAQRTGYQADEHPVKREALADDNPADGTRVHRIHYPGRQGNEVVLYKIEGGGHTWPQGIPYLPKAMIGRVSQDLDATRVIWDFFKSHPKKPPKKL